MKSFDNSGRKILWWFFKSPPSLFSKKNLIPVLVLEDFKATISKSNPKLWFRFFSHICKENCRDMATSYECLSTPDVNQYFFCSKEALYAIFSIMVLIRHITRILTSKWKCVWNNIHRASMKIHFVNNRERKNVL